MLGQPLPNITVCHALREWLEANNDELFILRAWKRIRNQEYESSLRLNQSPTRKGLTLLRPQWVGLCRAGREAEEGSSIVEDRRCIGAARSSADTRTTYLLSAAKFLDAVDKPVQLITKEPLSHISSALRIQAISGLKDQPMGFGAKRNAQCPCGSGKKYKRCHLARKTQLPLPFNDIVTQSKGSFSKRYCLLHSQSGCKGRIVSSHTIPHSKLRLITRNGNLYVAEHALPALFRNSGQLQFCLKGAARCTTFSGFCQQHDKYVFAPLEDRKFEGTDEQCFLLYFRALARELYNKRGHDDSMQLLRELDRGRTIDAQIELQRFVADHSDGIAMALRDLDHWWTIATECLTRKQFGDYSSALFYMDQRPRIACCGAIFPEFDFHGKALQTLTEERLDLLSFTMMPLDSTRDQGQHGVGAFVWHRSCGSARALVDSLLMLEKVQQANALMRFIFEHLENVALGPEWWDSMDDGDRRRIAARQHASASPFVARNPTCLTPDGVDVAAWNVSSVTGPH